MRNKSIENAGVPSLIESISKWHHDRNLVDGATDAHQFVKLTEEVGELAGNIARGKDISDDVGDIIVVLINHCERNDLSIYDCLLTAWMDIKDRKGKMIDGMFVKESDLRGD